MIEKKLMYSVNNGLKHVINTTDALVKLAYKRNEWLAVQIVKCNKYMR
jgi:hypothetical protein